jgi:hypothetical protein
VLIVKLSSSSLSLVINRAIIYDQIFEFLSAGISYGCLVSCEGENLEFIFNTLIFSKQLNDSTSVDLLSEIINNLWSDYRLFKT